MASTPYGGQSALLTEVSLKPYTSVSYSDG